VASLVSFPSGLEKARENLFPGFFFGLDISLGKTGLIGDFETDIG